MKGSDIAQSVQIRDFLLQALETESIGIQVYRMALQCVVDEELKKEWEEYLRQTERHEKTVRKLCEDLDVDAEEETPGRIIVRHLGESYINAMSMAQENADADAAQIVATECVVLAESKDHQNWELIGELARNIEDSEAKTALQDAYNEIEDEEDEHYYHTRGWARELWIEALGLPAVLPPPEEEKDVRTAMDAARAKQSRKKLL